jgi:predicted Zn-dependent peptidase
MKNKIVTVITLFLITFSVSAQIDRTIQPKPGPAPKINIGKPETFELKNGLKVLIVENHVLPRVSATLTINNNLIFEGDKAGVSNLTGSLLGTGTNKINKDAFNEEVDYLGANINFSSQSASMRSLSKYFPRVLELMADAALHPIFTQEEFDKESAKLIENLKSGEKSVSNIANRVESALAYGKNHPYGEFSTPKSVKNVNLNDVKNFYNTYFKPNNAYLVIVGDVNFKDVKKLVKKYFSDWKKGTLPAYNVPAVNNVPKTEIDFVNMPNAVQSNIAVVNSANLKMSSPDYFAVKLANYILGGGGEGRLFLNLREDKGYTYGAYSSISSDEKTSALFSASAQVRNMVSDSAAVEFVKEINKIRNTKVTDDELRIAKAAYTGSFVRNVEKPATIARYALNIRRNNLPDNFYESYLQNINKVTVDDIQRVAQKYFSADHARIIVVGKALDVLPNLEKLPYKINYFDKEANKTSKPDLSKPIPAGVTKQTVLDHYFNAIGGVDKIKNIKSTLVTYEATAMGNTVQSTEKRTADKYANETSMGGNVVAKIIMTKDGVTMNKQPLPEAMAKDMTSNLGTFLELGLLQNENSKLTGIEPIDGKDAYVITTKGDVVSTSIYFDVKTGLKVRESQTVTMGGRTQTQAANFSDYKDFNGVKFASVKTAKVGPQNVTFKLINAKIDEGVTDADFQ